MTLELRCGEVTCGFHRRTAGRILEPPGAPEIDAATGIRAALEKPIESAKLRELADGKRSAVVVVPDLTRDAHLSDWLHVPLAELDGVTRVTLLVALGLHRPMTPPELDTLLGRWIRDRYPVEQSRADEPGFVELGATSRGTPLEVHPTLLEADLRVTVGEVDGHYFAGFSGGRKAVVPGCASRRTITANHRRVLGPDGRRDPRVELGKLSGNPLAEDLAEAQRIVGIDFACNLLNNPSGRPAVFFCGEPDACFAAAVDSYAATHRVFPAERYGLVIASAGGMPADIDLRQSHKALDNACRLLEPGGRLIFLAACPEGTGPLEPWLRLGSAEAIRRRLYDEYAVAGQTAWSAARKLETHEIVWVGELREDDFGGLPVQCVVSLSEALESIGPCELERSHLIIPHSRKLFPL